MERLYIFKSGRLKRKENTLIFKYLEDGIVKERFLPVENISEIYLFGEVDLNTKVLNFLSQKQIIVHYFNYYGFYSGSILPRKKNVSGYLIVNQVKHYLDFDRRLFLAASFVDGATFHIARNLRKRGIKTDYVEELSKTIYGQKDIPSLMSVEGKIREFYYSKFSEILQNEFFKLKKERKDHQQML